MSNHNFDHDIRAMTPDQPTATATPRTDANRRRVELAIGNTWLCDYDFARTLERELSSAQAALTEAKAEVARLNRGLVTIRDSCENCTNGSDLREQAAQIIGKNEDKNPMVYHSEYYNCERFTDLEKKLTALRAEVAELREDRARLDWVDESNTVRLEAMEHHTAPSLRKWYAFSSGRKSKEQMMNTVRTAIDAARKEGA